VALITIISVYFFAYTGNAMYSAPHVVCVRNKEYTAMALPTGNAPLDVELLERRRILPLQKVAEITSLSEDTLKRNFPDKVRRLSARRLGMAIADVLDIGCSSLNSEEIVR
jgi:hypothetical protein